MPISIEFYQALLRVAQTHAVRVGNESIDQFNPRPVVTQFQQQVAGEDLGSNPEMTAVY